MDLSARSSGWVFGWVLRLGVPAGSSGWVFRLGLPAGEAWLMAAGVGCWMLSRWAGGSVQAALLMSRAGEAAAWGRRRSAVGAGCFTEVEAKMLQSMRCCRRGWPVMVVMVEMLLWMMEQPMEQPMKKPGEEAGRRGWR